MAKGILVIDACQNCPHFISDTGYNWCENEGEEWKEIKIDPCVTIPRWCSLEKAKEVNE